MPGSARRWRARATRSSSAGRGIVASLADAGAWGVRSGALSGRVGIVSVQSVQDDVDSAAARLDALGVDVAGRAYVHDDPQTASQDIPQAVLTFHSEQIAT